MPSHSKERLAAGGHGQLFGGFELPSLKAMELERAHMDMPEGKVLWFWQERVDYECKESLQP